MKRMKRVLALGMAVLMCMGLTACGKDFDAAGYTKSVLDANYHAQYDKYAEYRGISESDAKKEVTEGMRTQIESAFSGMDVSDEMMDKYIEVAAIIQPSHDCTTLISNVSYKKIPNGLLLLKIKSRKKPATVGGSTIGSVSIPSMTAFLPGVVFTTFLAA